MHKEVYILAIESSCDDTAAAVLHNGKILANVVAGQEVHRLYGGVVPELASRAHQQNIVPVVDVALQKAGIQKSQLSAIAFTRGPGLLGSLLVGVSFAKAMALALNIPLIEVHHMQAHVLAHFIDEPVPPFPYLCLTVSGGHTQIVRVNSATDMQVLGETIDDAAGEAFDKIAKVMGLPYPGGPLIDQHAQNGNPLAFEFPVSRMPEYDYSFSGLKTAVLYFLQKQPEGFIAQHLADLCASVQYTIIKQLMLKLKKAVKDTGITHVAIAGGVSANSGLRTALQQDGNTLGWTVYIPAFQYCTDNAGMIAMAAYFKYLANDFAEQTVAPSARFNG
ncbi:MAG: tRNA (adenosine(37)-N6)-threonylcarbamoyltransferase complex transferase subunit TsaD [Bacteroidia bacterium]|nr:tRNA (adenosine(37)-N6)-threonylcarbamoyltransferase complex transferase subunit TsaD [Bacteroidia bacterium]MBP7260898.1 tRNA (adenosine(37)-N6)-threonylcarbamoyltransferase complex transferase subunit TsaD [Bacteroidia bacterium]MBP9179993.1 tRNA (adenosine(37)-N6)-threonylcarbamoyltransferase complex transferase subunit TsaD [Bacteroidia bacterium]MBP9723437.1 tRNA (adenosine(37)-N6)-threonylcarbamoyltransferase complex transferase subunit TsaD [Bacteroidia bacterium]